MSLCLKTAWVGGVTAALLATTTSAAPPVFKEQNRNYGNSVYASSCNEIANGTICRDVLVWEIYDVKGIYEFTEAWLSSYRSQYSPEDGSSSFGYRYLTCPVGKKAITVTPNSATLEAVLDPGAFGCESYGYMESCDPINGCQYESWSYVVPMSISGEWLDPFSYSESISNQKTSSYDGWSGATTNTVDHCKGTWGDAMRAGGFSINARSWAFEGPGGPAWGSFSLSNCNSNRMQR